MIKVGDRFETNNGGQVIVVEYKNSEDILVEFCDRFKYRVRVVHSQIRKGTIKNPYAPKLFGVGYHGIGTHKSKLGCSRDGFASLPAYSAWTNMLSRCYDKNYINPEFYENTIVHEDWHCFQTFADWYTNELKYTGWNGRNYLDKDVLGDGSIYSEHTCCILPAAINSAITKKPRGKLLQGIRISSNGLYRVVPGYVNSNNRFNSEGAAHFAYLDVKNKEMLSIIESYKDFLNPKVYDALLKKDYMYLWSPFFLNPNLK